MKILIVGKGKSGQSDRLLEEAKKRKHELYICSSYDLVLCIHSSEFIPVVNDIDLTSIDLIHLLVVGEKKWEWYVTADFLNKNYGIAVIESKMIEPDYKVYFSPVSDFIKAVKLGIKVPDTRVILSSKKLNITLKDFPFPAVVKNSYGQRGTGVSLVNSYGELKEIVGSDTRSRSFQIKQFIPNNGDIRVFTVGYKAIGAMKRIPTEGNFRSNISQGGRGEAFNLEENPKIKEIAEIISEATRSEIAGVDIIVDRQTNEPYFLEINRGPQFAGLEKYTAINVAEKIIEYYEQKLIKIR